MDISDKLRNARRFEEEALQKKEFVRKPDFHICAPTGWINDPNGFSEYKNEKHLFFQYHPYDTSWGPMHWGHMKTKDFIKWEQLPVALAPDMPYDSLGCFSGSAVEWNGEHILFYTGVKKEKDINGYIKEYQIQCIAVGDGTNYKKLAQNPVVDENLIPAGGNLIDFRDPKAWIEGEYIYFVVGNRGKDNSGQILMYRSKNLEEWEYVGILDQCNNRYGKMWECPDFFELDGQHILIVSPQEMQAEEYRFHAGDGTIYISGEYDKDSHNFIEKEIQTLDHGLDFYAPQTMLTSDHRRILIAWMQSWSYTMFGIEDGFSGMMTLPRELTIKDGILYQSPVSELEHYRTNKVTITQYEAKEEYEILPKLQGRIMDMEVMVSGESYSEFHMKIAADDTFFTELIYDKTKNRFIFSRFHSHLREDIPNERKVDLMGDQETLKMRIIMDRYSVEIFFNDGEQVFTSLIKTPIDIDGVYIKTIGKAYVDICKYDINVE